MQGEAGLEQIRRWIQLPDVGYVFQIPVAPSPSLKGFIELPREDLFRRHHVPVF